VTASRWQLAGKYRAFLAVLAMLAVLLLAGCLPIPNVPVELDVAPSVYLVPPGEVEPDYFEVAGVNVTSNPGEYDRSGVLRYRVGDVPSRMILVLMPGIFGGAANFDIIARELVASTRGLEVWSVDRRSNLLEDRSGMIRALEEEDPEVALHYYLTSAGEERGFQPLPEDEAAYLRNWGLDVHLGDLHRIVLEAREEAPVVVLGGHSLGASIVTIYASREFEGGHGQEFVDGLLLIDGFLGRTGGFGREDEGIAFGPIRLAPSVAELEAGGGPPYSDSIISPEYQIEREIAAIYALLDPDGRAPAELSDFPTQNRALVGIRNDEEYAMTPVFGASLGEAVDARFAGNLGAFLLAGREGARSRTVTGVAPDAEMVRWSQGEPDPEPTNLDDFIRMWTLRQSNPSEWYFPLRLGLDMTLLPPTLADTPGYLPSYEVTLPTLLIGASRGLVPDFDAVRSYVNARYGSPVSVSILPGFTHLDVVTARDNPAVGIIRRWLELWTRVL